MSMSLSDPQVLALLRDISAKQDTIVDRVGKVETAVAVDAATTAQTRDKIDSRFRSLEKRIDEEIMPHVNDIRKMKVLGNSITGIFAFFGLSVGVALINTWGSIWGALKSLFSGG